VSYQPKLHVVLHQPEIPQNTGNVGRTCLAAGAKLWLVRPLGFRLDETSLRRAGLDYWPHLEWEDVDDWPALLDRLAGRRLWFFSKTASRPYTEVQYEAGDVLVFGGEAEGLPRSLLVDHQDRALRIPIRPPVRSLNLANAVAITVFEALRQWREQGLQG
jgi:tRNA (cytidine/uridine-2'-O-)-methyltransferase